MFKRVLAVILCTCMVAEAQSMTVLAETVSNRKQEPMKVVSEDTIIESYATNQESKEVILERASTASDNYVSHIEVS